MKTWTLRREDLMTPADWARLRASLNARAELAEQRGTWTAIQDRTICMVAVWTGLRRSDLAALNCGDLYLTNEKPYVVVRHGRGDKYREVLLSPDCRAFLRRAPAREGETRRMLGGHRAAIRAPTGSPVHRRRHLPRVEVGVPPGSNPGALHPQGAAPIRNRALLGDEGPALVQKQLGHSRITTARIYADVLDEDALAGMQALDRVLQRLTKPDATTVRGRVIPDGLNRSQWTTGHDNRTVRPDSA